MESTRNSVFIEICHEFKQEFDHRYVAYRYFGSSRSITKEKLGVWLETVSHLLDQYCIPWLQKAAPLAEEVRTLRGEKSLKAENLAYQKRIFELQNQVIEKRDEQLRSVKTTVEAEMKLYSLAVKSTLKSEMESYPAAVSKICSSVFAPKKLQAVVQKVAEKKERSSNIIVRRT